jgi:hypothetical protein
MARKHKSGNSFAIITNARDSQMMAGKVYLRTDARRIDLVEEFSHWRMQYGDKFLQEQKKMIREAVNERRLSNPGQVAEEIAIKSYMIDNSEVLGLEQVDVDYLSNQIQSLWKYGQH